MDLTITLTKPGHTLTFDSVMDADGNYVTTQSYDFGDGRGPQNVTVHTFPAADTDDSRRHGWRYWLADKHDWLVTKRGYVTDYPGCDYTLSHTRQWCGHALCRLG